MAEKSMVPEDRFLTIEDLSKLMGVAKRTIYNKLHHGTFPIQPKKFGNLLRWKPADVNAYIESL